MGAQVDPKLRKGALRIMQSFMRNVVNENLNYQPGYLGRGSTQNILSIRLRIEHQYYESAKFKTLLGNPNSASVGWDDKIDYLMMRRKKIDEDMDEVLMEEEMGEIMDDEDMSDIFASNLKNSQVSGDGSRKMSSVSSDKKMSMKVRLSTSKKMSTNVRALKLATFADKNVSKTKTGGFVDLDEKKQEKKFKDRAKKERNAQ